VLFNYPVRVAEQPFQTEWKTVKITMRVALVLALVLGSVGFAPSVASATPTTLTPNWSTTLNDVTPSSLQTSSDGTVTGSVCGNGFTTAVVGLDQQTGDRTSEVPVTDPASQAKRCVLEQAVGKDGTAYVVERIGSPPGFDDYSGAVVSAYRNSGQIWTKNLGTCMDYSPWGNTTMYRMPESIRVGADGNVYFVATWGNSCSSGGALSKDTLVKLSAADGSVRFQAPLNSVNTDGAWKARRLSALSDGVAVSDGTKLRYFDFNGVENLARTFDAGDLVINHAVSPSGVASFEKQDQYPCSYVKYYGGYASLGSRTYSNVACSSTVDLIAVPGSKVAMSYTDGMYGAGNRTVKVVDDAGNVVYDRSITVNGESGDSRNTRLAFDEEGNLIVAQIKTSGQLGIDVYDSDGFHAAEYATSGVSAGSNKLGAIAVTNGKLFVDVCNSSCYGGSVYDGSKVYAFSVPGVKVSYPSGYLTEKPMPGSKYAAMGDSFASGEGNPPFESGTQDGCRRSPVAYAHLLDSYSEDLVLTDFVACSGATTNNVLNGQGGEGAQTGALDGDDDVVTVSIGGNDIGFADYAKECVLAWCGPGTTIYDTTMSKIGNVHGALENTYETILNKSGDADVYVIGYPHVTPVDPSDAYCAPFRGKDVGEDDDDSVAARNVVDALNGAIRDAVDNVKSDSSDFAGRLHFVSMTESDSPFEGHDVCAQTPAFVYPAATDPLLEQRNWFHPNSLGHTFYEEVISEAMN
jgi:hypothetical protein